MEVGFLGVVFILHCLVIGRSHGAEKLLNEDCGAGDTCVDVSGTNIVLDCDSYYKRCLIKVEQSCTQFPAFCVSGASCVSASGKCACDTGFTAGSGVCTQAAKDKAKGDCSATADATTCNSADGAACVSGVCTCDAGYNISTGGSCGAVAVNTIGATCTPTSANPKGNCEDTNAVCAAVTGARCSCKSGYYAPPGGTCSVTPHKVGGLCKTATALAQGTCGNNAVCSATANGVCRCARGHSADTGDADCTVDDGKVNGACTDSKPCTGDNADCVHGVCTCSPGYTGSTGDDDCIPQNKVSASGPASLWLLCGMIFAVSLSV